MLKSNFNHLTPTKLRALLIGTIVLMLVIGFAAFWLVRNQLVAYAEVVSKDTEAATISNNDIAQLQKLQKTLEEDSVAVTRAKNIVAESKSYQYQNQIIDDITSYAKKAGLQVMSFTFDDTGTGTTPTAGTSAAGPPDTTTPQLTLPGLKSVSTTVSVNNPAKYESVMKFIRYIELNLTKMQLTGITLSKGSEGKTDVSVGQFIIEVYTR